MKKTLIIFILLTTFAGVFCNAQAQLAKDGMSSYSIYLSKNAIPAEKTAAKELQYYLKSITNVTLPIASSYNKSKQILVGQSAEARQLLGNMDFSKLKKDEIILKTVGDKLILSGARPRGTLYAVYTFLEDSLGVCWWSSSESYIPKKTTLELPVLNIRYAPVITNREAYYQDPLKHYVFACRMKNNGNGFRNPIPINYGGRNIWLGGCHTFDQLLPASKYLKVHPEWYSLVSGRRVGGQGKGQLCLTNLEMRNALISKAKEWLRKNPEAYAISISQNDNVKCCQCEKCRALEKSENSPSGPLIHFVNKVAKELEKEFPKVKISTLAYRYSRKAPAKIKPRKNVIIRLCSIEADFSKPIASEANLDFQKDVEAWSKISNNLAIWNYVTNFSNHLIPHPNIDNLAKDIRFFVKHKAVSIFEQGDNASGEMGDFPELRVWVISHLLWNPTLDAQKLIDQFVVGYYGKGAPYIKKYLQLLAQDGKATSKKVSCYESNCSAWLKLSTIEQGSELLKAALNQTRNTPVVYNRIKRVENSLKFALLSCSNASKWADKNTSSKLLELENLKRTLNEAVAFAKENKLKKYNEGENFPSFVNYLNAYLGAYDNLITLPEKYKKLPRKNYAVFPGKSFSLYKEGRFAFVENDPGSTIKRVVKMPGTHREWAMNLDIPEILIKQSPKWRVFIAAKADYKNKSGKYFHAGSYDRKRKKQQSKQFLLSEVKDKKYQLYDMGRHTFTKDSIFYIAPDVNSSLNAIYIDYVLLIKE